ncbi:MAG: aminoacetone oxidase family FAD-binding enzyme [Phyllobacteriaceae bacterium]|nr:aminoacetone oxidase family FAD-binding enzyme [Phyllobacteriaceae bacterium]MBA91168.1 aminoacetone oxidase family FAD-binding enzyme [Phyllobacteriaceae bacterium]
MQASCRYFDVIILGAGAAGLMCAGKAGQAGLQVALVDHMDAPGKKILISGGGRCNFTNRDVTAANFLSANRHFAKSALGRYRPADFIALIEKYAIAWHEKTLGQLFCNGSARQVVDMLIEECPKDRVALMLGHPVSSISHDGSRFSLARNGEMLSAPALVVATGGLSVPKLGASGLAYDIARQFGCRVVEPRPALVPLTLPPADALFRELSGIAAQVTARAGKVRFSEAALFTHKGLSGPAILQVSSYWKPGEEIRIDFLPDEPPDWLRTAKRERPRTQLKTALGACLPERLAIALAEKVNCSGNLADFPDKTLAAIESMLSDWPFHPNGTEGFAKAEVTSGGVSTAFLSSRTMMAKHQPGLYFIGEAVDVTGWLGGYNFQWAWASAVAAASALAEGGHEP